MVLSHFQFQVHGFEFRMVYFDLEDHEACLLHSCFKNAVQMTDRVHRFRDLK